MKLRRHLARLCVSLTGSLALASCLFAQNEAEIAVQETSRRSDRCSIHSVRGTYSMAYQGTVYQDDGAGGLKPVPAVFLGKMSIDPADGTIQGGGTVSVGGQIVRVTFVDSFVEVESDCTAAATYYLLREGLPGPVPVALREEWVLLEGGSRVRAIVTQFPFGPEVSLGTFDRVSWAVREIDW